MSGALCQWNLSRSRTVDQLDNVVWGLAVVPDLALGDELLESDTLLGREDQVCLLRRLGCHRAQTALPQETRRVRLQGDPRRP